MAQARMSGDAKVTDTRQMSREQRAKKNEEF
jgi:hypothetical protein